MNDEQLKGLFTSLSALAEHGPIPVQAYSMLVRPENLEAVAEVLHQRWLADHHFAPIAANILYHIHKTDSQDCALRSCILALLLNDYRSRLEVRSQSPLMFRNSVRTLFAMYPIYVLIDECVSKCFVKPMFNSLEMLIDNNPDYEDVETAAILLTANGRILADLNSHLNDRLILLIRQRLCSEVDFIDCRLRQMLLHVYDLWAFGWNSLLIPDCLDEDYSMKAMLRATASILINPWEASHRLLIVASPGLPGLTQSRGRRRTLTPPPWVPPVYEKKRGDWIDEDNRKLLVEVDHRERELNATTKTTQVKEATVMEIGNDTRRTGLLARKIGMLPQWTTTGERILCTMLEVRENHVVSVTSPDDWYRKSIVGKKKAFNREGPLHKVTIGALDGDTFRFTGSYRNQFVRAGIPVKQHLGSFLVSEEALPEVGAGLDVRHFSIGQYITATGKSIDWGFQGGMHRWGMRGQPTRRTTKSHRRIGSVGAQGEARIWPGKRMPGHMGFEWVTVSGLQIVRMNLDKQVIYVKGSVPGDAGDMVQLKDCLQKEKKIKQGPVPTWTPNLETIAEEEEEQMKNLRDQELYVPTLFRFSAPSIQFSDSDAKKAAGRDKTKAKIARVKK